MKHNNEEDGEDEEEEHDVGDHDDDGYEQLVEDWGGRLQQGGGHLVKHNGEG